MSDTTKMSLLVLGLLVQQIKWFEDITLGSGKMHFSQFFFKFYQQINVSIYRENKLKG